MTSVLVAGLGETGVRAARQLLDTPGIDRVVVAARTEARARAVADALHDGADAWVLSDEAVFPPSIEAIASAVPAGADAALARAAVERGVPFASVADHDAALTALLALDEPARARGTLVVAGCGLAPGLADVLVRHAAGVLDSVDEVHVARFGIGGPACAGLARRTQREPSVEWRDRPVEIGRHRSAELIWFPDPVGARECELVATGVELLAAASPGVARVTVRLGVPVVRRFTPPGRRDPAAGFGAVRAEVWGWRGRERATVVYGVIERTAVAAGTVLGVATAWLAGALPDVGEAVPGAFGLGTAVKPAPFLAELARRGVKAAVFEGVAVA
ncbi:MAG: hypothetical protein WD271_14140 [Acidimicrobiia bacterium]